MIHWFIHAISLIAILAVWLSARREIARLSDQLWRERQLAANKVSKITDLEEIIRRAGN